MPMPHREILVLGDASVGKTSLIYHFCNGVFPSEHDKLAFRGPGDMTSPGRVVSVDGVRTHLIIHRFNDNDERSAQQSALWDSWYRFADVIVIVYDITSHSSFLLARSFFDRVQQSRARGILPPARGGPGADHQHQHLDPMTRLAPVQPTQPVIIVGNKAFLKDRRQVSREEATVFAQGHGIIHLEVDAHYKTDVDDVFLQAARMAQYFKDGVVRNGGLVANPDPFDDSVQSPTAVISSGGALGAGAGGAFPAPSAPVAVSHAPSESRLGRFFTFGRRRGSSAASAISSTSAAPAANANANAAINRRVSKDEGIDSAPERALEYHRAGSRGGGGGGGGSSPFGSFSSASSRWGSSRDASSHYAAPGAQSGSVPTAAPGPWPQQQQQHHHHHNQHQH